MISSVRILSLLAIALACGASARAQSPYRQPLAAPPALDPSTCQMDGILPPNVQVTPFLRPAVREMLRRSDDFRRQCAYLAARPRVYVRVLFSPVELPIGFCARSVIQRMTAGPLMAFVTIGRRVDSAEWIAHEIEHVIEQAEGLRMKDLRRQSASWESAERVFETMRAIEVGRIVRDQMRRKPEAAADN